MTNLKNAQLYAVHAALTGIKQERNIPPMVLLLLMRVLRAVEPALLDCEKVRLQIVEEYAVRDSDGAKQMTSENAATVQIDPARAAEFEAQIAELLAGSVEVPGIPASALLRIPDGVLSLETVSSLEPLIIDDEVRTVVLSEGVTT